MSQEHVNVRRAVANYLVGEIPIEKLHELVVSAFAVSPVADPNAAVVNLAYGLLTDVHGGLLKEDALRDALRPLVTSYSLVWSLMADPIEVTTGSSDVPTSPVPVQRPLLRHFDRSREEVSA